MAALAYGFFRDLAEVVGRMLALQDDFSTSQVQSRLTPSWGDRNTSKEAAQKLITSLVDFGVLRKANGRFRLAQKITTSATDLQLWLLEAMLSASDSDEVEASQFLRLPALFPFAFTVGLGDLRGHEGFSVHRQGLDMDMVAIRPVSSSTSLGPGTKVKQSGSKQFTEPDQPSFFR
jgi:hypothetical protein